MSMIFSGPKNKEPNQAKLILLFCTMLSLSMVYHGGREGPEIAGGAERTGGQREPGEAGGDLGRMWRSVGGVTFGWRPPPWPTIAHLGPPWTTMAHSGPPWPTMTNCEPWWAMAAHSGTMGHGGPTCPTMANHGPPSPLWPTMAQSGSPWPTRAHSASPWPTMALHGLPWHLRGGATFLWILPPARPVPGPMTRTLHYTTGGGAGGCCGWAQAMAGSITNTADTL